MNALETTCMGCRKCIRADSVEQFRDRAARHVRNCAAVRSLAGARVPRSPVLRFVRAARLSVLGLFRRLVIRTVLRWFRR